MRTTINLDPRVLRSARVRAARTDRSLSRFVEDALREVMAKPKASKGGTKLRLPTVRGRLQPGVDYDSMAALLDLGEPP